MNYKDRKKIIRIIMHMHLDNCDTTAIENVLNVAFPGVKVKKIIESSIGMYKSLVNSIYLAGGAHRFTVDKLEEWTLMDVIDLLSINNIRFVHIGNIQND